MLSVYTYLQAGTTWDELKASSNSELTALPSRHGELHAAQQHATGVTSDVLLIHHTHEQPLLVDTLVVHHVLCGARVQKAVHKGGVLLAHAIDPPDGLHRWGLDAKLHNNCRGIAACTCRTDAQ